MFLKHVYWVHLWHSPMKYIPKRSLTRRSRREIYSTFVLFILLSNEFKRSKRKLHNRQWELNFLYKGWVTAFKSGRKKALCKCCDRMDSLNFVIKIE